MRRERGGELVASRKAEAKLHGMNGNDFCRQEATTFFATRPSSVDLKMKRANEYDTPTDSAIRTNPYSVSLPV